MCLLRVLTVSLTVTFALSPALSAALFLRGDADANGDVDITDPLYSLAYQFFGGLEPPCLDALDDDDNGQINIGDPVRNLHHQFLGLEMPAPGSFSCGEDPTLDFLDCQSHPPCQCLSEEEFKEEVVVSFSRDQCLRSPALVTSILGTQIVVCPQGNRLCNVLQDGCPLVYTDVDVAVDFDARIVEITLLGGLEALPVKLSSAFGGESKCTFDVTFDGPVHVPFVGGMRGEDSVEILGFGEPGVDRGRSSVSLALSSSDQGAQCDSILTLQELFVGSLIDALEEDLALQVAAIGETMVGLIICRN